MIPKFSTVGLFQYKFKFTPELARSVLISGATYLAQVSYSPSAAGGWHAYALAVAPGLAHAIFYAVFGKSAAPPP